MLNGPAARLGEIGDTVIVLSYATVTDQQAARFQPVIVTPDRKNQPTSDTMNDA